MGEPQRKIVSALRLSFTYRQVNSDHGQRFRMSYEGANHKCPICEGVNGC